MPDREVLFFVNGMISGASLTIAVLAFLFEDATLLTCAGTLLAATFIAYGIARGYNQLRNIR